MTQNIDRNGNTIPSVLQNQEQNPNDWRNCSNVQSPPNIFPMNDSSSTQLPFDSVNNIENAYLGNNMAYNLNQQYVINNQFSHFDYSG